REPVYLRLADGRRIRMPVHRWHEQPTAADKTVLKRCNGPVLDVGCGPGRMCRALLSRGVFALGVDIAPRAVALTTTLGGLALCRSVFDRLPAERGWQTVLLIDGNIGIGGDPQGLLRRCGELVAPTPVSRSWYDMAATRPPLAARPFHHARLCPIYIRPSPGFPPSPE
ncbi:class I SAM-dependent methyltransferase, partial [Streptomyces sp. NPDC007896]|uniref:class I SAM-dependent methyltransferase n=1 Tax=Streptomyces sp. NPDC007896 TaxID=3364784 RepID=UPI0036F17BEE